VTVAAGRAMASSAVAVGIGVGVPVGGRKISGVAVARGSWELRDGAGSRAGGSDTSS